MTKRMIMMLLLVGLVFGGIFGFKMFQKIMIAKYMAGMGNAAQTVTSIKAEKTTWQPKLDAVGTIKAINGSDIASEVAGIVASIPVSSTDVKEGETLVSLRAEDAIAKLASLEAQAAVAKINAERSDKLAKTGAVSQATLDSDRATLTSLLAQVDEQKAIVAKKTIRAPFEGRLGIRQVDIGQYVAPGTTLVTLQQLDPIYVDFYVPEQALPQLTVGRKISVKVAALANKTVEGEISAINAKIDESTRNIMVRATLKNEDRRLLPGMFANVRLETGATETFITLPQTAITYNPYGNTIFIVSHDEAGKAIAKQSFVTTGQTRGDQVAVLSGVQEGDEVVTTGQLKLRNGVALTVKNDVVPKNDAAPNIVDQ